MGQLPLPLEDARKASRGPLRAVVDAGPGAGVETWLRLECGHEKFTSALKLPRRSYCTECEAKNGR